MPATGAALSKALTVFAQSNAGIVDLIATQGMNNCVGLFCVCFALYVGSRIAMG
jgi:hypothetical protein